jgi:hypothetical protein
MHDLFVALGRSLRSLKRLDVLGHLIWPSIAAALLWIVVAVLSWASLVDAIVHWTEDWGWFGVVAAFMAKFVAMLAFVPLFYVTAALFVAVVALPMMLDRVARSDYADLEQRRGGSNAGSIGNTLVALLCFVLIFIVSLPLWWLIPGGGALIVPVFVTGWLNQRVFGYDALMLHADRAELDHLRRKLRSSLLLLGCLTSLLAYVPLVNIIAPAFSGLAFVHFLLEALRRERGVGISEPGLPGNSA